MEGSSLYNLLQLSSLEQYYNNFVSQGIDDPSSLLSLTMQDYPGFGITSMSDRERLFGLIQQIKDRDGAVTVNSGRTLEQAGTPKSASKTAAKRPRISTADSPSLGKVRSKTQIIESRNKLESKSSLTPIRNLLPASSTGYNYGVPSVKPKSKNIHEKNNEHSLSMPGQFGLASRIKVCVRKRPLGRDERESGEEDITEVHGRDTMTISAPKVAVDLQKYTQKYPFVFDEVFDEKYTNREVYERTAKPLVNAIFTCGVKATCFAYGCTGSGKTYTMLGTEDVPGLYLLAASDIFTILHSSKNGQGLSMCVSFYEIYCGQLFDLLNGRAKLFARENATHQVCITGLTEKCVGNVEQLMEVIESGGNARSTGATGVNADSSRSHAILQLELKSDASGKPIGRFSFIDLAGSERAVDVTDTDKQTRMEGAEINQSLLALKECIRSLDQDSRHTPFRQSKLTQVLKDSFVGNTMTCMIANISPNLSCCENTLNTLRYADRVKELKRESAIPSTPARPFTVHGTDSKFMPQTADRLTVPINQDLNIQISKSNSTDQLHKAMKRLKMDEAELLRGNTRPHTMATPSRVRSRLADRQDNHRNRQSSHGNQIPPEGIKPSCSADALEKEARGKESGFARTRSVAQVLKVEDNEAKETEKRTVGDSSKRAFGTRGARMIPARNAKPSTSEGRPRTRFAATKGETTETAKGTIDALEVRPSVSREKEKRTLSTGVKKSNGLKELEINQEQELNKPGTRSNRLATRPKQTVMQKKETEKRARFASRDKQDSHRTANIEAVSSEQKEMAFKSRLSKREKQEDRQVGEMQDVTESEDILLTSYHGEPPPDEKPAKHTAHARAQVPVVGSSNFSCTKSTDLDYRVPGISDQGEAEGWREGGERRSDQGGSPPVNNRYSQRIKARLARLFNGKTADDPDIIPVRPAGHLDPIQVSPRALTEEQIVAAHHTHLAMVTGLCHEEMVLLKHIDKGEQDFQDYVTQLEDILLQKRACIESLHDKISRWKTKL